METIIIAILGTAAIVLSSIVLKLRSDAKKFAKTILETEFEMVFAIEKIEEQQEIINNLSFKKNDDFVTFLEESREMAFSYIETVQDAITKFVEVAGPTLDYYDKFGRVVETPHSNMLDKIFDSYNELIKILPETENNKENNE